MKNGENPKVSVIIPVYNAERFLDQCLQSLFTQTLLETEVIMVNDGSTDRSQEICRAYADKDSRFVLINQENGGSAAARRTGMLAARGEYIGFVDADDWCEPDMYEKMYHKAEEYDADIVFCNCYRDSGDKRIECSKYIRNGYYDRQQILDEILPRTLAGLNAKGNTHVIRWANYLRIYRRSMIEANQIYNDPRFRRCQDLQLTFEATLCARSYYYMGDDYLYHNRVVEGSQSRGYTKDQWNKIRILIETLYDDVERFTERDLKAQMDLCAFFFAVYSCENESRPCDGLNKTQRKNNIQAICDDVLCERFLPGVPYDKLSKVNQAYYQGLKLKSADRIWNVNKQAEAERRLKAVVRWLLSNGMIRKAYLSIRKAVK